MKAKLVLVFLILFLMASCADAAEPVPMVESNSYSEHAPSSITASMPATISCEPWVDENNRHGCYWRFDVKLTETSGGGVTIEGINFVLQNDPPSNHYLSHTVGGYLEDVNISIPAHGEWVYSSWVRSADPFSVDVLIFKYAGHDAKGNYFIGDIEANLAKP